MKINILNKLIVDRETIDRVEATSVKESRKSNSYSIFFKFKDGSTYNITYGSVHKNNVEEKNKILASMGRDIETIYNQITNDKGEQN